jgi:hypothetical protein
LPATFRGDSPTVAEATDSDTPSAWSQLKGEFMGVASIFMATESESDEADESTTGPKNNTIDIDAILESESRRGAAIRAEEKQNQNTIILIGTTTTEISE